MDFIGTAVSFDKEKHGELLTKVNPKYGYNLLVQQLIDENWKLYEVKLEDSLIGLFICRTEKEIDGTFSLVLLHAVSQLKTVAFHTVLEPLLDKIAKGGSFSVIWVHSDNKALDRIIEKHTTYVHAESVYRKDVV